MNWAQFTRGRITLLRGLPSSIVFPGFVYMSGRVTLGGTSHYLLSKVTFPFDPLRRATLLAGLPSLHANKLGLRSYDAIEVANIWSSKITVIIALSGIVA